MDALISGRAGLALLVDDGFLASIHAGAPDEVVPRSPADLPLLFGSDRGFRLVEDVTREQVSRQLIEDRQFEAALQLVLLVLDAETGSDIRRQAAGELQELLGESTVGERLEGVLYASSLPKSADQDGALLASRSQRLVRDLLKRLVEHQDRIQESVRYQITEVAEQPASYGDEEDHIGQD